MANCLKCGEFLILEDDENVMEDKEFYCEDCKETKYWKDKFTLDKQEVMEDEDVR